MEVSGFGKNHPSMKSPLEKKDGTIANGFKVWILQDWKINSQLPDSQAILVWFRLAQWAHSRWPSPFDSIVVASWLIISRVLGIDIPVSTYIGPRLHLWHYFGIVIHPNARLGADCQLRHGVTIGNKGSDHELEVPDIGSGVDFGAYSAVLGQIEVGNNVKVGAHAILTKSVPAGVTVVGNPGKVIRTLE
jgi:serine acetyltransferase